MPFCSPKLSFGLLRRLSKVTALMCGFLLSGGSAGAEITLEGSADIPNTELSSPRKPRYSPFGTCVDRTDELLNANLLKRINSVFMAEYGRPMSDFTNLPELLLIEQCKNIFVISTVLGESTMGRTRRIIVHERDIIGGVQFEFSEYFLFFDY